jgi:hypothetical protein
MNPSAGTAARLVGFAVVVAVVLGGAWALGAQVGPVGSTVAEPTHSAGHSNGTPTSEGTRTMETSALPGLAVARDGYRLVLADDVLDPGTRHVAFTIEGPDGRPVTDFEVEHEKPLHLIVVRRDHAGFQHLHPTLDQATGTWSAVAQLSPGQWRVFADFTATGGPALVLGGDLLVPGRLDAPAPTQETRTDEVDGYTVGVDGTLRPGTHSELTLRVTENGVPVTDLQPYLGAFGHLVALREGDLAYLHVHPAGEPGYGETTSGPDVEFGAEVPSAGRYHLYLDFRHAGVVRTAHLVLDAGPTAKPVARAGRDAAVPHPGHAHEGTDS